MSLLPAGPGSKVRPYHVSTPLVSWPSDAWPNGFFRSRVRLSVSEVSSTRPLSLS